MKVINNSLIAFRRFPFVFYAIILSPLLKFRWSLWRVCLFYSVQTWADSNMNRAFLPERKRWKMKCKENLVRSFVHLADWVLLALSLWLLRGLSVVDCVTNLVECQCSRKWKLTTRLCLSIKLSPFDLELLLLGWMTAYNISCCLLFFLS